MSLAKCQEDSERSLKSVEPERKEEKVWEHDCSTKQDWTAVRISIMYTVFIRLFRSLSDHT